MAGKVFIRTFGCQTSAYDSAQIAGLLITAVRPHTLRGELVNAG